MLILAEVAIVIIPFETANLINEVKAGAGARAVSCGNVLVLLRMISLGVAARRAYRGSGAVSNEKRAP